MLAVFFALSASFAWGISDFAAGLLSRRFAVVAVVFWSQLLGIPPLLAAILLSGTSSMPHADFLWGALAGLFTAVGLSSLYWAMALDMISVVAPVAALAPVIPVLVGLRSGDQLSPLHWIGVVAAVLGVLLLSIQTRQGKTRPVPRWSLGVAAIAAIAFGCWFVVMRQATETGYGWAILGQRSAATLVLGIVLAAQRIDPLPSWRVVPALIAIGTLDLAGTALYAFSSHLGLLGVVSVLSSLYPLVTVALALVVVKERINSLQRSGIVVALAAVACLAT